MHRLIRLPAALVAALGLLAVSAGAISAHPHVIGGNGQVIANGQNHYAFVAQGDGTFLSCDTFTCLALAQRGMASRQPTTDPTQVMPAEATDATWQMPVR